MKELLKSINIWRRYGHILVARFLRTIYIIAVLSQVDLLLEEARYFELTAMVRALGDYKRRAQKGGKRKASTSPAAGTSEQQNGALTAAAVLRSSLHDDQQQLAVDCVIMNVSPDLGERVSLSAERQLLQELFPELSSALADYRSGTGVWTSTGDQPGAVAVRTGSSNVVLRFPLNGYANLNSLQVIQTLMSAGFEICASAGAGVEGQQFSEYIFRRRRPPSESPASSSSAAAAAVAAGVIGAGIDSVALSNTSASATNDSELPLLPVIKRERLSD